MRDSGHSTDGEEKREKKRMLWKQNHLIVTEGVLTRGVGEYVPMLRRPTDLDSNSSGIIQ